ncbi:MAG: 16S rRNA (cytosine(967)-C(5))-methyltransferase RsmB [Oscillospiraceae bacterium]|nr:16S rRNA (cytosine(967)-C(5))-methyltransferase RsmB [Oscillospiraceae bacterium]
MKSARATAVSLLMKTFTENGYSNLLLDKTLADSGLSVQEKAFCTQLYYGVTERLLTLEHLLKCYSDKKPEKLDIPVKYILYLGFYQMKYCDKIPDSAAVNESVRLAGQFRKKSASGFINAVLRKFQRSGKEIPLTGDKWTDMQIQYSAPAELLKTVTAEHGEDFAVRFFADSLLPPPDTIRLNPLKSDTAALQVLHLEKIETLDNAYQMHIADVRSTEAFQKGLFHVQDLASQFCCQILDPKAGETVLDVCAAPGGKTFTIAEIMQNQGNVYAYDLHPHRAKLIQDGAERLNLSCVHTGVQNAAQYQSNIPEADRILCDVPCSGLGVIRRKPEIKYKSLADFASLPDIQYQILETSAKYLKKGGILVYSTCTVLKRENQEVVQKFLKYHPEFSLVPFPEYGSASGMMTFSPAYAGCDGFFAAKLRRKAE